MNITLSGEKMVLATRDENEGLCLIGNQEIKELVWKDTITTLREKSAALRDEVRILRPHMQQNKVSITMCKKYTTGRRPEGMVAVVLLDASEFFNNEEIYTSVTEYLSRATKEELVSLVKNKKSVTLPVCQSSSVKEEAVLSMLSNYFERFTGDYGEDYWYITQQGTETFREAYKILPRWLKEEISLAEGPVNCWSMCRDFVCTPVADWKKWEKGKLLAPKSKCIDHCGVSAKAKKYAQDWYDLYIDLKEGVWEQDIPGDSMDEKLKMVELLHFLLELRKQPEAIENYEGELAKISTEQLEECIAIVMHDVNDENHKLCQYLQRRKREESSENNVASDDQGPSPMFMNNKHNPKYNYKMEEEAHVPRQTRSKHMGNTSSYLEDLISLCWSNPRSLLLQMVVSFLICGLVSVRISPVYNPLPMVFYITINGNTILKMAVFGWFVSVVTKYRCMKSGREET